MFTGTSKLNVFIFRSILHALTDTGLESYTGRIGHNFLRAIGQDSKDEFSMVLNYCH
jgi:hypothetical protein